MTDEGIISQSRDDDFQMLPRTTFVKASETMIRSPSGSSRNSTSSAPGFLPKAFMDRGTDAEEIIVERSDVEELVKPFTSVFPLVEDLIIHFTRVSSDEVFEYVLRSYKNGSYPVLPPDLPGAENERSISPISIAVTNMPSLGQGLVPTSNLGAESDDAGYERPSVVDPHAAILPDMQRKSPQTERSSRADSAIQTMEPPTPTMPPAEPSLVDRFVEFTPLDTANAINVQNSLRRLLSIHFPGGENGFSQHCYPASPDTDRFWKPVFRNDDTATIGSESRTVDQIIALGCEKGVKKDFFFQISGQIERFGVRRDGTNMSGKVDIRYEVPFMGRCV